MTPRVLVHLGAGSAFSRVARSTEEIERGLAGRASMHEGDGMLFDLGAPGLRPFWMRGVTFPLDLIFLDRAGVVVGILENLPPGDATLRRASLPYSWVLEVVGGWSRRHGVRLGQQALALAPRPSWEAPEWVTLPMLRAWLPSSRATAAAKRARLVP